jgi:hypothetical protein
VPQAASEARKEAESLQRRRAAVEQTQQARATAAADVERRSR